MIRRNRPLEFRLGVPAFRPRAVLGRTRFPGRAAGLLSIDAP